MSEREREDARQAAARLLEVAAEAASKLLVDAGEAEKAREIGELYRRHAEGGENKVSPMKGEGRQESEVKRVGAEDIRVDYEDDRVSAESERVQAEVARAQAEERRGSVRYFYAKLAAVIALPLAFIALIPAVVGLLYVNSIAKENRATAREAHDSLCSFKRDIGRRHDQTAEFVAEIKSGVRRPIPGISTADLERSRDNLQITLKSLSGLDCG